LGCRESLPFQIPEDGAGHDTDALLGLGPADDPLRQATAPGVPGMKLGLVKIAVYSIISVLPASRYLCMQLCYTVDL
jgi:hypothetical protein